MKKLIKYLCVSLIMVTNAYGFKSKGDNMSIMKKDHHNNYLAIDMYEKNGNIIAKMDVPGIESGDIKVEIEDGQLHVFGERRSKEEINEQDYYYQETGYGRFDRLVSLPTDINQSGMQYDISDGVLTVTIPKK
jgi:HSP20 family molecular chaperone IbpA